MAERESLSQIAMQQIAMQQIAKQQTASKHAIAIADLKLKHSVLSQAWQAALHGLACAVVAFFTN
jgi:hypothetical protein